MMCRDNDVLHKIFSCGKRSHSWMVYSVIHWPYMINNVTVSLQLVQSDPPYTTLASYVSRESGHMTAIFIYIQWMLDQAQCSITACVYLVFLMVGFSLCVGDASHIDKFLPTNEWRSMNAGLTTFLVILLVDTNIEENKFFFLTKRYYLLSPGWWTFRYSIYIYAVYIMYMYIMTYGIRNNLKNKQFHDLSITGFTQTSSVGWLVSGDVIYINVYGTCTSYPYFQ